MVRFIATLMVAAGILVGQAPKFDRTTATTAAEAFCPECWKFTSEGSGLDMEGRCLACGKKPVMVEAGMLTWVWCPAHQGWHRKACAKTPPQLPSGSIAILFPQGSLRATSGAYCPADRILLGIENLAMPCPVCTRPLTKAESVQDRWYWCSTERLWRSAPCSMNHLRHCCTQRKGAILAYPFELPMPHPISYEAPAPKGMLVAPEWLVTHLDEPHIVVLHIGFDPGPPVTFGRDSFYDGHIPGARPVAWQELTCTRGGIPNQLAPADELLALVRGQSIDVDDRIVLYDTGLGLEAARAYFTLDYLGLAENAAILDGGWSRWRALGYPKSRSFVDPGEPSGFVPNLRPEVKVTLSEAKDLSRMAKLSPPSVVLLDARRESEYTGMQAGRGIRRAGHIPGAVSLSWERMIVSKSNPVMKGEAELRELFVRAGARPGMRIMTYCRSGTEAPLLYFVAKYLEYTVQMYEGSYGEWCAAPDTSTEGYWETEVTPWEGASSVRD